MHRIISVIVYAEDSDLALHSAEKVLNDLSRDGGPIDYYVIFESKDDNTPVAGTARWGKNPGVVDALSSEGELVIKRGMAATRNEFNKRLDEIRDALKTHTNNDLWTESSKDCKKCDRSKPHFRDNHYFFRHNCHNVPYYTDNSAFFLVDEDSEAIVDPEHLENVLTKYKSIYEDKGKDNPNKDKRIWVVTADAHY